MGLFTALLTLPLAPVRGVVTVAQVLEREAYRQWTDPATVRAQLADVEAAFEAGELTEAERDALQDDLVARLVASRTGVER
jgi:hypothetical protein